MITEIPHDEWIYHHVVIKTPLLFWQMEAMMGFDDENFSVNLWKWVLLDQYARLNYDRGTSWGDWYPNKRNSV